MGKSADLSEEYIAPIIKQKITRRYISEDGKIVFEAERVNKSLP
jgi:hypothetical protein